MNLYNNCDVTNLKFSAYLAYFWLTNQSRRVVTCDFDFLNDSDDDCDD